MPKARIQLGNAGLIKSMNKQLVLDILLRQEMVSRAELAEKTGLAMPTVMRIVETFIADGLVTEIGKGDSNGGRKPVMLQVEENALYFLGTDLSSECHSMVINVKGKIVGRSQCRIEFQEGSYEFAEAVCNNMRRAIAKSGVDPEKIVFSGIATPAFEFKFIRNTNQYFAFWASADKQKLQQLLDIGYPCVMENVARLGAVAEARFGIGKDLKDFLYIYSDQGIGMGAVIDGNLENGHMGVGCEFGHTSINFAGQQCYCGRRGCVETYASAHALVREYETNLLDAGKLTTDKNRTPLYEVLYAAEANRKEAVEAAKTTGNALGVGIANLINLYNPEAVIMGGLLCKTLPLYVESAVEAAKKNIFIREARDIHFYEASIDMYTETIGAAAWAMEKYFNSYCER